MGLRGWAGSRPAGSVSLSALPDTASCGESPTADLWCRPGLRPVLTDRIREDDHCFFLSNVHQSLHQKAYKRRKRVSGDIISLA